MPKPKSSIPRRLLHKILESNPDLYGDGHPYWTQGKRLGRSSSWLRDAETDRDTLVARLRRPSNRNRATEQLATKIVACTSGNRCFSGACPICQRATQKVFVNVVHELLESNQRPYSAVSIVPRDGRFKLPPQRSDLFRKVRTAIDQACDNSGLEMLIGGFDPGVNEHIKGAFAPHGQIQLWGFAPRAKMLRAKKALRAAFPSKGANRRPVRVYSRFSGELNGLAYAFKPNFFRRVSLPRIRDPFGKLITRRNTRLRELRVKQQCDLAVSMDRAGLEARIFLRGVEIRIGKSGPYLDVVTPARTALDANIDRHREKTRAHI